MERRIERRIERMMTRTFLLPLLGFFFVLGLGGCREPEDSLDSASSPAVLRFTAMLRP